MSSNEFRPDNEPGYTEWSSKGDTLIAQGDLFLDKPLVDSEREDRSEVEDVPQKLASAMGEKALNPWQVPGYLPSGAGPRSVAEVAVSVEKHQAAGAYDREVLAAREEIGRFERGEKS